MESGEVLNFRAQDVVNAIGLEFVDGERSWLDIVSALQLQYNEIKVKMAYQGWYQHVVLCERGENMGWDSLFLVPFPSMLSEVLCDERPAGFLKLCKLGGKPV